MDTAITASPCYSRSSNVVGRQDHNFQATRRDRNFVLKCPLPFPFPHLLELSSVTKFSTIFLSLLLAPCTLTLAIKSPYCHLHMTLRELQIPHDPMKYAAVLTAQFSHGGGEINDLRSVLYPTLPAALYLTTTAGRAACLSSWLAMCMKTARGWLWDRRGMVKGDDFTVDVTFATFSRSIPTRRGHG
jgi:hypothetical protein